MRSWPAARVRGVDTITGTLLMKSNSLAAQTASEKISVVLDTAGVNLGGSRAVVVLGRVIRSRYSVHPLHIIQPRKV